VFRNPLRNYSLLEIQKKMKKKDGFERRVYPSGLSFTQWGITKGLRLYFSFLINRYILVFIDLKA